MSLFVCGVYASILQNLQTKYACKQMQGNQINLNF